MMMTDPEEDVRQFMEAMGQRTLFHPDMQPDRQLINLRMALLTEEFDETISAMLQLKRPDLTPAKRIEFMAEVIDGLADLIYVALGAGLSLGLPVSAVWDEVQRANMDKANGPVRQDGKRLKPEGWQPPRIERAVRELIAEQEFADRSITG